MKIGIGIDTGGTCTDGVIYDLEEKKILAAAKTATTKEDLAQGIKAVLDLLPKELLKEAQVVSLSTTLATNACVEGKGGRGRLIFLGIDQKNVERVGAEYGLPMDDTLIYVECRENLRGEILKEPDWCALRRRLKEELADCHAVGIVELFANATGAALEKKTREIVEEMGIPCVCGYELFQEKNAVGRGAGALLNARLISVIAEFLSAVKKSMQERQITAPVVIVRSDGSLMTENLSKKRPVETLLSGPVASVMGAAELHRVKNGVVIDMGGTTTDISLITGGVPVRSESGVTVGNWTTYVKGMYVDTFGLGGDSEVVLDREGRLSVGGCRVMPFCMAAARYPRIRELLKKERESENRTLSWRKNIYVGLKDISKNHTYSEMEQKVAKAFYQNPMSLIELEENHHCSVYVSNLDRLVRENVIIRCGITPTDAMHVLGDFQKYDAEASLDAVTVMAECLGFSAEELCQKVYGMVREKLYCNIVRILLEHKYPQLRKKGLGNGLEQVIREQFEEAAPADRKDAFLNLDIASGVPLIGVGGPTGVFLEEVAKRLGTHALISPYANVANALGAAVGNVEVYVVMEIQPDQEEENFRIFGNGESCHAKTLEEAEEKAAEIAGHLARTEALRRGAVEDKLVLKLSYAPVEADTAYGSSLFISEKVTACAGSCMEL